MTVNHGIRMPPKFWQYSRHKFQYKREIQAVRRFIKKYGEPDVIYISMHNSIRTWTDYAAIEFKLQERKEYHEMVALPKDTSEVTKEVVNRGPDLRQSRPAKIKRAGLFDRLQELSGESQKQ